MQEHTQQRPHDPAKGSWDELLREGRALYTTLIVGGVALHGTQTLVIAIIMPSIVAEIGGAAYYAWAAMLYTIGSIVGASSTGPIWARLGARRGYTLGAVVFSLGTLWCALAPGMASLIVARGVQGWAGGLIAGGGLAMITSLFDARLRTRALAVSQATFTVCHLLGPVFGGSFVAINWWRGSFLVMLPMMVAFAALAWLKIPDRLDAEQEETAFPLFRLATLSAGALCVAATGPMSNTAASIVLIVAAVGLVGFAFRLDAAADNKLFPSDTLSPNVPVSPALAILTLHAMSQTAVMLFLPLLLLSVHGLSPVLINLVTIILSIGWTTGTFVVSGWSGARERMALMGGPMLALAALIGMTLVARNQSIGLVLLSVMGFVMGLGIGSYHVHLIARTMEGAPKAEHRVTAAALTSSRSLGNAFGAAIAGVVAHAAGLGDVRDADTIGIAVTAVFTACWIPLGLSCLAMLHFLRLTWRRD